MYFSVERSQPLPCPCRLRATARPTGWWRWCTIRSRVLTSAANHSSWTTVSEPTAPPPTDRSSAARATAATDVVPRLAGFPVKHRENVRDGLVPEDYVRHLEYKGQEVALASESEGYRFKLTPPVPVPVLHGDVRGNARATI